MTHLYTTFQFKISICNGDNERKLKINGIFLSPRDITQPKIIWPDPNSNSTCVFLWQTYVLNFNWKSPCMTEITRSGLSERDKYPPQGQFFKISKSPLWPWPFDLKIYRAHPGLMGSLHVKFHDERCKGKAVMRRKPFSVIYALWPWPLTFWPQNL